MLLPWCNILWSGSTFPLISELMKTNTNVCGRRADEASEEGRGNVGWVGKKDVNHFNL
jgi:hypothetical protein